MNDRFKFRMYDTNVNKMYMPNDFEEVESIYECIKQQINWDLDVDYDIKFNHLEDGRFFMQSTGLKDKNGKLIYEGDFVKYTCPAEYCSDGLHKCQDCCSEEIASIHFDEEQAMFTYRSVCDQCSLTDNINTEEDLEVIGNIYENKELLNEI